MNDKIIKAILARLEAELYATIAGSPPQQPNQTYMLRYVDGRFESTPVDMVDQPRCTCGPIIIDFNCPRHKGGFT